MTNKENKREYFLKSNYFRNIVQKLKIITHKFLSTFQVNLKSSSKEEKFKCSRKGVSKFFQ